MYKDAFRCRGCGSEALTDIIDLGPQWLGGQFVRPDGPPPLLERFPLRLIRCDKERGGKCGLVQLAHSVDPELLYSNYWYRSEISGTMRIHLQKLAIEAEDMLHKPFHGTNVLDIGCNSGYLLKQFDRRVHCYGVDPCDVPFNCPGATKVKGLYPKDFNLRGQFDLIFSIAMFYDLDDPVSFAQAIERDLTPNGLWCVEVAYLPQMLAKVDYSGICHEHVAFYSFDTLNYIIRKAGMKIVHAGLNDCNGGSIRVYAAKADCTSYDNQDWQLKFAGIALDESLLRLEPGLIYSRFTYAVKEAKKRTKEVVDNLCKQGKRIHLLGASTKGNTILQYCDLSSLQIDAASDRDARKHGCHTLGTHIPIISEEASRALKPDAYLCPLYFFKDELIKREAEYLKQEGQIVFLPQCDVVKAA